MADAYYRILAVDPGTHRIGLALSDDMRQIARPLKVLKRSAEPAKDLAAIQAVAEAEGVAEVICGMPYRMDGSESDSTARARALFEALVETLAPMRVREWDETLTSWEADQWMTDDGIKKQDRKAWRDAYAAAVLLDDYLKAQAAPGFVEDDAC